MATRAVPRVKGKGTTFTRGDGYYFKINSKSNGNAYVICTKCNVRGKLVEGQLQLNSGDHSHPPGFSLETVAKLKAECKGESRSKLGEISGRYFPR